MRRLLLPSLLLAGVALAAPLDVREIWQPLPHPSLPLRSPVLTGLEPPPKSPAKDAANVVLVTVDTWRADRLSLYGSDRPTSPFLDELAAEAVVFDRAYAPTSWTWPTMVSLASGVHPRSHGAIKPETPLCEDADTLAEVLYRGGWRTGFAGVNTYFEPPEAGYRQGFEFFWAGGLAVADTVLEYAGYFLDGASPEPFFLHAHFFDPHCPFDPEESVLAEVRTVPQGHRGPNTPPAMTKDSIEVNTCQYVPPVPPHVHEEEIKKYTPSLKLQDYLDYYDAELLETDRGLRKLRDRLQKDGVWDESWVIFTGDHGEEFGEHGHVGHGDNVYGETTWVPLLIKPPKGHAFTAGRVAEPVSLVDVPMTIIKGLGKTPPASWQGLDLAPALRGEPLPSRPVLSETMYKHERWGASLQKGGLRFVLETTNVTRGHVYGIEDPLDGTDGIEGGDRYRSLRAHGLAGLMRAELQALNQRRLCDVGTMDLDPTHWEALRKLGYVAGPEEAAHGGH